MSDDSSGEFNSFDPARSLGAYLRGERERRGLTLEQVASATRINQRVLQLLEADSYGELPAKPFIRGFVISYCRFIGVDGRDVFQKWEKHIDEKVALGAAHARAPTDYVLDRREGQEANKNLLTIGMGVLIVVGGATLAYLRPSKHHGENSKVEQLIAANPVPSGEPSSVPVAAASPSPGASILAQVLPSPSPSVSPSVSVLDSILPSPGASPSLAVVDAKPSPQVTPSQNFVTAVAQPTPSASPSVDPADPLNSGRSLDRSQVKRRVILKALADVWVRYQVDGRAAMKFILRKDKILVLRAEGRITLQVSNPKSLLSNINFGADRQFSTVKPAFQAPSGSTWVFSESAAAPAGASGDAFEGQNALPKTSDPTPESSVPSEALAQ